MKPFYLLFLLIIVSSCEKKEKEPESTNPFDRVDMCDPSGFPEQGWDCKVKSIRLVSWDSTRVTDSFVYDVNDRLIAKYTIENGTTLDIFFSYEYDEDCSTIHNYTHYTTAGGKVLISKEVYNNQRLAYSARYDFNGGIFMENLYLYENGRVQGYISRFERGMLYNEMVLDEDGNVKQIKQHQIDQNVFPSFSSRRYEGQEPLNPHYRQPGQLEDEFYFSPHVISRLDNNIIVKYQTDPQGYLESKVDSFSFGFIDTYKYRYYCP